MFKQEREAAAIIPDAANARIKPSYFAMSFPALNGEVVMRGHADYCEASGHAKHEIVDADGNVIETSERCPRCGKLTDAAKAVVEATATKTPSTDTHDIRKAWQFVVDSYDGSGHSPSRRDWTDAEVFGFAAEHHIEGIAAFELPESEIVIKAAFEGCLESGSKLDGRQVVEFRTPEIAAERAAMIRPHVASVEICPNPTWIAFKRHAR
jgi:hypothetical protein